mmetsp:Transcript_11784/g.32646  ORF Transcript_11784/g.32646 Transcript_11784/m.32646 type:complete len:354 (+) Transcript_11784:1417-2478(+)
MRRYNHHHHHHPGWVARGWVHWTIWFRQATRNSPVAAWTPPREIGWAKTQKYNNPMIPRILVLLSWMSGWPWVVVAFSSSSPSSDATTTPPSDDGTQQLKVTFVTGNSMKVHEVQRILAEHAATRGPTPEESMIDLRIVNVDLPELQEVDTMAIAKDKALLAAQLVGGPCLIEDTSLQFTALGGMPGPYIKWFQDRLKSEGLYNILAAYDDKSATAVCTLAFCPGKHADPVLFTGECRGTIVEPIPGRGFGWDSIFVPHRTTTNSSSSRSSSTGGNENNNDNNNNDDDDDMEDKPFSLMSTEEKNQFSHRGKAVRKWAKWLGQNIDALVERQEGDTYLPGHKGLDFKIEYSEQ